MLKLLLITVFVTTASVTPATEMISRMIEAVYIPEKTIILEGIDSNGVQYVLKYERSEDLLEETIGGETEKFYGNEMEPFLRLFFFQLTDKPESLKKRTQKTLDILSEQNIDISKTSLSVSDADGSITVSIGTGSRFDGSNSFQIYRSNSLPASLKTGERKVLFSDYHKSPFPLTFPGRIDILENGELISSVFFLREEYRD